MSFLALLSSLVTQHTYLDFEVFDDQLTYFLINIYLQEYQVTFLLGMNRITWLVLINKEYYTIHNSIVVFMLQTLLRTLVCLFGD